MVVSLYIVPLNISSARPRFCTARLFGRGPPQTGQAIKSRKKALRATPCVWLFFEKSVEACLFSEIGCRAEISRTERNFKYGKL